MNNLFYTEAEGEFTLTTPGIITVILLIAVLMSLSVLLFYRLNQEKTSKEPSFPKRKRPKTGNVALPIVYASVAMALGIITSEFLPTLSLPLGGSITLFSMLFIVLIGYWFGAGSGILTALAYGLLQFVLDPKFISFPQVLLDYILAFGALGISGFFCNQKHGLIRGYIAGVAGRFFFAFLAGVVIWGDSSMPLIGQITYSLAYQASYLIPEMILTLIVLAIPSVNRALAKVKQSLWNS